MKAATFASIIALGFAGAACSQNAPEEPAETAAPQETGEQETPQFNLRYPGSGSSAGASASGEFNLRLPDAGMENSGPRLPEGAVRDNALSDVPEIDTPALPQQGPAEDPDDDIIRLD